MMTSMPKMLNKPRNTAIDAEFTAVTQLAFDVITDRNSKYIIIIMTAVCVFHYA